jgi:hypothetical protein
MSSSFNNFHGRLRSLFHVLSDDHIGSMPRFAPGSLATREKSRSESMDVEVVDNDNDETNTDGTPGTPRTGTTKRKLSTVQDDGAGSASKLRPRR